MKSESKTEEESDLIKKKLKSIFLFRRFLALLI